MEKNSERAGVGAVELTTAMAQMKDAKNQKPSGGEEQKWVPKIFWRICITNLTEVSVLFNKYMFGCHLWFLKQHSYNPYN